MPKSSMALPRELTEQLQNLAGRAWSAIEYRETLGYALGQIGTLSPSLVARADVEIAHAARLYEVRYSWPDTVQSQLYALPEKQKMALTPGLNYLYMFHRSGYVREAALDRIDGPLVSPFWYAAVALRMNDWVAEVRMAAVQCALRTFPRTPPENIAQARASLAPRLDQWRRWGRGARDTVERSFGDPKVQLEFIGLLMGSTLANAAGALRSALHNSSLDHELPSLAQSAAKGEVRAVALSTLISKTASWCEGYKREWVDKGYGRFKLVPIVVTRPVDHSLDVADLIRQGAADRSSLVRRAAVMGLVYHYRSMLDSRPLVERLATDKSYAVRWRAEYIAGQMAQ